MATKEKIKYDDRLLIAFVQGAKWWEFEKTGATMWPSDQRKAEEAAIERYMNCTLGIRRD